MGVYIPGKVFAKIHTLQYFILKTTLGPSKHYLILNTVGIVV